MSGQYDSVYLSTGAACAAVTPGRLKISPGGIGWKADKDAGENREVIIIERDAMKSFSWCRVARGYQLRVNLHKPRVEGGLSRETFDGFKRDDYEGLAKTVSECFNEVLEQVEVSTRGWNWGAAKIVGDDVRFTVRDKLSFELPVAHIANSNIAGKTEVSMEFLNPDEQQPAANTGAAAGSGAGKKKKIHGDQLVEMRLYVPGSASRAEDDDGSDDGRGEGEEEESAANAFHEAIKARADIGQVAGDGIIVFKEVLLLTPRGRFDVDMYPTFLRLRGKTYDYKVLYSSIKRLFLLPRPDDVHVQFVVGLEPGIRQGQTRYPYLVLQFVREEEMDAELNLDDETLADKYEGKLKKRYEEPTFKVVTTLFRVLTGQRLIAPGADSFQSASASGSAPCVKCNVKATDGLLYPLDKQLIWTSKQPIHVFYADIHQVVFSRVGGAVSSSKTFDLKVVQRTGPEHTFQSITREEHDALEAHFQRRKVRVKSEMNDVDPAAAALAELSDDDEEMADIVTDDDDDEDGGRKRKSKAKASKAAAKDADAMDEDEDSEEDEDFAASSDDGGSPSEASSDEGGAESGSDDMADSKPAKKRAKKA